MAKIKTLVWTDKEVLNTVNFSKATIVIFDISHSPWDKSKCVTLMKKFDPPWEKVLIFTLRFSVSFSNFCIVYVEPKIKPELNSPSGIFSSVLSESGLDAPPVDGQSHDSATASHTNPFGQRMTIHWAWIVGSWLGTLNLLPTISWNVQMLKW